MLFTQSTRLAQISSPLGPDVLLLKNMGGGEELGRLFDYELQLTSNDAAIDLNQLLGKPMSLSLQLSDGGERHFHGIADAGRVVGDVGQAHEALVGHAEPHIGHARARDINGLEAEIGDQPGRHGIEGAGHENAAARFGQGFEFLLGMHDFL